MIRRTCYVATAAAVARSKTVCHGFAVVPTRNARRSSPLYPLDSSATPVDATPSSPRQIRLSSAAQWHRERRRQMIKRHGDQISSLERDASSQSIAVPLLAFANISLLLMSIWSGSLHPAKVLLLSLPGSMLSLWQLQILHDCLHGSMFDKSRSKFGPFQIRRQALQDAVLFWGSMPSAFGYYLYLRYGHLTHHKNVGDPEKASLAKLFDSSEVDFEDGDVLFVAHRMKIKGDIGPTFTIPSFRRGGQSRKITMSISKMGFNAWERTKTLRNVVLFASSFMYERMMLVFNDTVVALTGKNFFFPNKPKQFHDECATYCRIAVLVRALLWAVGGWKSLLFLYLSETLWSIPPHPASAMFVTNHGSATNEETGECIPSSSTYAGRWYSLFTLGTNYHAEHHDFPTIPLNKLGALRDIAPEFYRKGTDDNVFRIIKGAFADPDFYACMDAGIVKHG